MNDLDEKVNEFGQQIQDIFEDMVKQNGNAFVQGAFCEIMRSMCEQHLSLLEEELEKRGDLELKMFRELRNNIRKSINFKLSKVE
jgi:hypothetical protein